MMKIIKSISVITIILLIVLQGNVCLLNAQTESGSIYDSLTVFTYREYKPFWQTINFNKIDYELINAAVFHVTNEQRVKNRKTILTYSPLLEKSATYHSDRMVSRDFFNHIDSQSKKSKTPNDRAIIAGIKNPYIAENISEISGIKYKSGEEVYVADAENGVFTRKFERDTIPPHTYLTLAEQLVDQWMNSPGHRKNILSEDALQLGCGIAFYRDKRFYQMPMFRATQNFQEYEKVEQ